jgi:signal transduction histidine kinase
MPATLRTSPPPAHTAGRRRPSGYPHRARAGNPLVTVTAVVHHWSVIIGQRLPTLLLLTGTAALSITVPVVALQGATEELPWVAGTAIFLASAVVVWRRRPGLPAAWWFAVAAGLIAVVQTLDGLVLHLGTRVEPTSLAWVVLGYQLVSAVGMVALAHLFGLFPDGRIHHPYERRLLRGLWWLVMLPPLVLVARPTLLLPAYHQLGELPNPYHLPGLAPLGTAAGAVVELLPAVFVLGLVLLVPRYRRAEPEDRRRIRWLLPPMMFAAAVVTIDLVAWRRFPDGAPSQAAEVALTTLWVLAIASLPVGIAIALLRPTLLDVDRVIRKSLVYGLLWSLIALTYVAAAAGLGLLAGRRFPLGLAIALAVAATLLFQPARQRLERAADRWVFGEPADPTRLITDLGATLEGTLELERLLPRMADTLQTGLRLRWARVRLDPAPQLGDEEPALTVPIFLDGERLGVVECGPRSTGPLTADDEAVVTTFARQAALAVRNVRLTAELDRSRVRLVRAQDVERRRIERDLHDGVQQHLVALMAQAGRVRGHLDDEAAAAASLAEVQDGLHQVLKDLRELAHGIHPSLLSDRGLLAAVEALAARNAVPVSVRADPELRDHRYPAAIEGAGYFTVAEALANACRHAAASHIDVSLARSDESLHITVHDDGAGFDPATAVGEGLANLGERLAALGGRLDVTSRPDGGTTVTAQLRTADG